MKFKNLHTTPGKIGDSQSLSGLSQETTRSYCETNQIFFARMAKPKMEHKTVLGLIPTAKLAKAEAIDTRPKFKRMTDEEVLARCQSYAAAAQENLSAAAAGDDDALAIVDDAFANGEIAADD